MSRRQILLGAVLGALLLATTLWAAGRLAAGRDEAARARRDLGECLALAERIDAFRRQPARAHEREQLASETIGRIERAAAAAEIPTDRLVRIEPGTPERLGQTAYREKPTRVTLRRVTLRQLAAFAHDLESGELALTVKSIRLAARGEEAEDGWSAELIVSYLIYEPPHPTP